jgi:hypothetical protein
LAERGGFEPPEELPTSKRKSSSSSWSSVDRTGVPTQFTVVEAVRAYLARPEIKAKLKKKRGA